MKIILFNKEDSANSKYILICIQSNKKNFVIFTNFYDNLSFFPSFQMFSYQLVYLNPNENFTFSFDYYSHSLYRIIIKNINGNGKIFFDNKLQYLLSGNQSLAFIVKKDTKNIYFCNMLQQPVVFNLKIDYGYFNPKIEELRLNCVYRKSQNSFPIVFILNDTNYLGADLNFYFESNNSEINKNNIIITGYIVDYDTIKRFTNFKYLGSPIKVNGNSITVQIMD